MCSVDGGARNARRPLLGVHLIVSTALALAPPLPSSESSITIRPYAEGCKRIYTEIPGWQEIFFSPSMALHARAFRFRARRPAAFDMASAPLAMAALVESSLA